MIQRVSKMLPVGPTVAVTLPVVGGITCPLQLLKSYRNFFREELIEPHMAAFMDLEGNPYTYKQALRDARYFLDGMGLNGRSFGTHSFRIGLASEAGRLDFPDWEVQMLGRWNSDCFKRYIQTQPDQIANLSRKLKGY